MTQEAQQTYEYKAEMKQLLHLIVHSLYTHPEIFLRELVSNASDALNKVRYQQLTDERILNKDKELAIRITVDPKLRTFAIEDSGIGMTQGDLMDNIGTVARSGTLEFLQKMRAENKNIADLIGQFGVGFYSVFMVTDQVTIETRHADQQSQGYRWESAGEGRFRIDAIEKPDRGTKIHFTFKDTAEEFAEPQRIKAIIKKYSNFADFPIFVNNDRVNTIEALWRKKETEINNDERNEFYKFITNDFEDPLSHLHLAIESPGAEFKALLFIPRRAPFELMRIQQHKTIQFYSNKMMIMDNCRDLLPEYLQFVRGVVDTSDLPLNISRETIQSSPVMAKIKGALTAKILQWLQRIANREHELYVTFYKTFGLLFKTGLTTDLSNREKLIELQRFESSREATGVMISLRDYVGRMRDQQKGIYYLASDTREYAERNPNLEYFRKHDIEVLFLLDPVDIFIVPSITEYKQKPLRAIDKGDMDPEIQDDTTHKEEDNLSKSLIGLFKETLKDRVKDVRISRRLVDSAVTLVTADDGTDPQMERVMKMMGQDVPLSRRVMEVNVDHPVIKNLSKRYLANPSDRLLKKCMLQLFESAQLIEGDLPSRTDYVNRMMEIMEEATK